MKRLTKSLYFNSKINEVPAKYLKKKRNTENVCGDVTWR